MVTEGSTIGWAVLLTRAGLFLETVVGRRADVGAELFQICSIGNGSDLAANTGRAGMATQIIMDLNGDTRHNFDTKDAKALLKAERRFKALTGAGFTAATRTASGDPVVVRTFDPTAEETLFFPRLVGG